MVLHRPSSFQTDGVSITEAQVVALWTEHFDSDVNHMARLSEKPHSV